jgi:hypothetical protein
MNLAMNLELSAPHLVIADDDLHLHPLPGCALSVTAFITAPINDAR